VDTGTLLDPYETSNHLDYDQSNPIVKKVYEQIKDAVKSFLEPFNRAKQKDDPISEKDVERAREIKQAMNQGFVEVPQFNPWDEGDEEVEEKCKECGEKPCICIKPPSKEWFHPWISSIVFEPKEQPYSIGDNITARVTISNTIDREYSRLHLMWKAQNASGELVENGVIESEEFGVLSRGDSKEPGQVTQDIAINISTGEGAFRRGMNRFTAELVEESHSGEGVILNTVHKRSRKFWVEQKPEPPSNDGGASILNEVYPFAKDGDGLDAYLDPSNRDMYVFTKHGPNIAPYWLKRGKHPIAVRNIIHAAGDEIMMQILTRELSNFDGELTTGAITDDGGLLRKVLLDKTKWVAATQKAYGI
jgi:hypothetical protein